MAKAIPDDYPRVSYTLTINGAADAVEFYKAVFAADERMRIEMPDGKIAHCELMIGDSLLMLAEETPEMNFLGPKTLGGTGAIGAVYVEDADATFAAALAAGATQEQAPETQFYGDRSGVFVDPFGHRWSVMTHVEDVDMAELERRSAEAHAQMESGT